MLRRTKGNQATKFGQLIKYNGRNIFLFFFIFLYAENEAGQLVPDIFLFYKKALYKIKLSGQHLSFNVFW